jgi:hypothetical protein
MDSFFAYNAKHNLSMQAFIYRHFTGGFFSSAFCITGCPRRPGVFYLTLLFGCLLAAYRNKRSVFGTRDAPTFPGESFQPSIKCCGDDGQADGPDRSGRSFRLA